MAYNLPTTPVLPVSGGGGSAFTGGAAYQDYINSLNMEAANDLKRLQAQQTG